MRTLKIIIWLILALLVTLKLNQTAVAKIGKKVRDRMGYGYSSSRLYPTALVKLSTDTKNRLNIYNKASPVRIRAP